MMPEYLLDLADKAAKTIFKGQRGYTHEDFEDARQVAAMGIFAAYKRTCDAGEGYYVAAGKNQVCEWLRSWLRYRRDGTLLPYLPYTKIEVDEPWVLSEAQLIRLVELLRKHRIRETRTAEKKLHRDVALLCLIIAGYSTDGIALELEMNLKAVYEQRRRLRKRLEDISEGVFPEAKYSVSEAGLEALRRIHKDPDILKKRSQTFRETMARKRQQQEAAS